MKKLMVLAMLLSIMVLVTWSTTALAGSAYSNAKADFGPFPGRGVDNAWGHAIINYVKGRGVWQVNGSVHNLKPGTEYKVQIGIQGQPLPQFDVGSFITDDRGKARFHYRVEIEGAMGSYDLAVDYEIVRIIDIETLPWLNDGCGGTIVMLAREDGNVGSLEFRGTGRGK